MTHRIALALTLLAPLSFAQAQQEGPATTQVIVSAESKSATNLTPSNVTAQINNKGVELSGLVKIPANAAQIAILIDDGLRTSFGRQLGDLKDFIGGLRPGTEILVGYMQNGRIVSEGGFTSDLAAASASIRLPFGSPGISASPYFAVSDFVKHWPGTSESSSGNPDAPLPSPSGKARFVLMITNGVDPYNGSVSPMNQNSPYVDSATADAQRAGIPVYSIYYTDAGIRGGFASFSGQSYLQQIAQATGGVSYIQGTMNPVSIAPFLKRFGTAVAESYVATVLTPSKPKTVRLKLSTKQSGVKLHAPSEIRPGTTITVSPAA